MIQVHVTPNNDTIAHELRKDCACAPYFGFEGGMENRNLFIHRADDERTPFVDVWANIDAPNKGWTIQNKLV